jgi:hypothetical protein
MKTFKNSSALFFLGLVMSLTASATGGTYNQSFTSVTGVTILGTTHSLGCSSFGVTVYAPVGTQVSKANYTYSVDATSFDTTINWSGLGSLSGSVTLQGCFSAGGATATWALTNPGLTSLVACGACAATAYADVFVGSINWTGLHADTLTSAPGFGQNGTIYVWLDLNTQSVIWGVPTSTTAGWSASGGTLQVSTTGYPSGAVPLGTIQLANGKIYAPSLSSVY